MHVYESKSVSIHLYSVIPIVSWNLFWQGENLRALAEAERTGEKWTLIRNLEEKKWGAGPVASADFWDQYGLSGANTI